MIRADRAGIETRKCNRNALGRARGSIRDLRTTVPRLEHELSELTRLLFCGRIVKPLHSRQIQPEQSTRIAAGQVQPVHRRSGERHVRRRQVAARITPDQLAFGADDLDLPHPVVGDKQIAVGIERDPVGLIVDLALALFGQVDQNRELAELSGLDARGTSRSGSACSPPPAALCRPGESRFRWESQAPGDGVAIAILVEVVDRAVRVLVIRARRVGEVNTAGRGVERQVVRARAAACRPTRSRPA